MDKSFSDGAPFTREETRVLRALEDRGCAVTVFVPSELNGVNPARLSDWLADAGQDRITTWTGASDVN